MAKYQKVSAFDRHNNFQASYFETFDSVSDAISTITWHKLGGRYKEMSDFAGWIFRVTPQDDSKGSKEYKITSGGNIRLLK